MGVRAEIRSKSSNVSSIPASRATASRWSTALVDPPDAATAVMAFSKDFVVMIWRGRSSRCRRSMTRRPADSTTAAFRESTAGTSLVPIGEMPIISKAIAIVLAVN